MTDILFNSPLKWPAYTPCTPAQTRTANSSFKQGLSVNEALSLLSEEIKALGPERATIYSDYIQLNVERLRKKNGTGSGVSVELRLQGKNYILSCDRWQTIEQNLYALHLLLRNFRLMEKWGVGDLHILMQGFSTQAMKPSNGSIVQDEWRNILGLGPTATLEDAHAVYRRRAKMVASEPDALIILNNAMDQARKTLI